MASKHEEIISYLKKMGLEDLSKSEKRTLYKEMEENFTIDELKETLSLLFSLNKSMIASYKEVSLSNMLSIYRSIDADMIVNLMSIYRKIREKSTDELETFRSFKKVISDILGDNENTNLAIKDIVDESFRKSLQLKDSLYLTMLDANKADEVLNNCISRSKLFLRDCDSRNLERIIFCLKKDFSLKDDEIVKISSKCASFFVSSSASKIVNLNKKINEFKEYIKNQECLMSTAKEVNELLSKDFKDVLFDASSVATLNPESVNKTLRFLMGEELGKLTLVGKKHFHIKGNFTPYQLAKIYNESISSLSISVEKIAVVSENIAQAYQRTYHKDLDLNHLITGHNFSSISQLTKKDYDLGKMGEIFDLLSMFISEKDMENLLKNNFSFLVAPVDVVKESLQSAVLNSSNKDELRANVLQKIRNHFDMYDGQFKDVKRDTTSRVETLNKVGVKDIDEEEIKKALERLETDSEDIENWEKKWSKDDKEYRNLEIQVELEDLRSEITSALEFLKIDFINIDQYVSETMVVKEMLEELEKKYDSILEGKKLNRQLSLLSDSCKWQLDKLQEGVNNNLNVVISMYEGEKKEMVAELGQCLAKLSKLKMLDEKRKELDVVIDEKEITEEKYNFAVEAISDVNNLLDTMEQAVKRITKKEKQAGVLLGDLLDLLKSESVEKITKQGLPTGKVKFYETATYMRLFALFIKSLEFEELVVGTYEQMGIELKVESMPYKQLRRLLNERELAVTDAIYKMYKENIEDKERIRTVTREYLKKYGLEDKDEYNTGRRTDILMEFATELDKKAQEWRKILIERAKIDENEISDNSKDLNEEINKLETAIRQLVEKIELLRKEQIKR